jgi:hypothetical protein
MDIDVMQKQLAQLMAFKAKYEPMLADALPQFEAHQKAKQPKPTQEKAPPQGVPAASVVKAMNEDQLAKVVKDFGLKVDLADLDTLSKKRKSVIEALGEKSGD